MTNFDTTDGSDYSKPDNRFEEARRAEKAKRLMFEMKLHTSMNIGNYMVLKVIGGWIYYDHEYRWACFVPDRRYEI